MPSFWSLIVASATLLGLCLWWVSRSSARWTGRSRAVRSKPPVVCLSRLAAGHLPIRELRSISFEELRLLGQCDHDCILVNVHSDPVEEPGEVAGIFVITISPSELPEVLRWLPADRTVAFHGVSASSFALIESSVCMDSPEPRCILENLPANLEIR
jgi:hypothetical protein